MTGRHFGRTGFADEAHCRPSWGQAVGLARVALDAGAHDVFPTWSSPP